MKKKIIAIFIILLSIIIIVTIGLYVGKKEVRQWIDKNIMKKEIEEEDLPNIEIEENDDTSIYAYSKYIAVIRDSKLTIYNDSASKVNEINLQLTKPKFCSKGKYLLIADENGQNLYLIYNDTLQWKKTLEGNITQITVNENGAVGVSISGTTYKSVIIMYDITGEESFKTYLSYTTATDISISNNSKYLSFSEVETTGTLINSNVKTIQVEKAKNTPSEAIINKYSFNSNELILKIKYSGEKLIALTDSKVYMLKDNENHELYSIDNDINFVDINLDNYFYYFKEESSGLLSSKYSLQICNINNNRINTYEGEKSVKNIYCCDKTIGINLGNEIQFINTQGWLVKEVLSVKNVKNIIMGNSVAGIVYKNRVDIVKI